MAPSSPSIAHRTPSRALWRLVLGLAMGGLFAIAQAADTATSTATCPNNLDSLFAQAGHDHLVIHSKAQPDFSLQINQFSGKTRPTAEIRHAGFLLQAFLSDTKGMPSRIKLGNDKTVDYDLRTTQYILGLTPSDLLDFACGQSDPYPAFFQDLTGDGQDELLLNLGTRGAYSYWTQLAFTSSSGKIRNILQRDAGTSGPLRLADTGDLATLVNQRPPLPKRLEEFEPRFAYRKDLNQNGRPEIVLLNSAIEQIGGETHGGRTLLILEWEPAQQQFVDRSRAYPVLSLRVAQQYLNDAAPQKIKLKADYNTLVQSLIPYYASMLLAGQETQAQQYLQNNGDDSVQAWLRSQDVSTIKKKLLDFHKSNLLPRTQPYFYK